MKPGGIEPRTASGTVSLICADGLRSFAMGYFTITFVLIAHNLGLSALNLGMMTGASVAVGIGITYLLSELARRRSTTVALAISGAMMAISGIIISLAQARGTLYISVIFGFLPPNGGMFIGALVEGVLAHTAAERRTIVFARNGMVVSVMGAIGALFASFPTILGMNQISGIHLLTWLYAAIGIAIAAVSILVVDPTLIKDNQQNLTPSLDSGQEQLGDRQPQGKSHNATINRLSLLFVLDASGSGVVTQTLVIFWLKYHFNLSVVALSLLYFGMEVFTAVSFPLAEWISRKIGLLNTAVFTHIPSSLLLALVPFAPTPMVVCALLLARSLLVEMDVPTRKSYIASIVGPENRKTAAARTSMGRQAGRSVGPAIGGFLLSNVSAIAPFLATAVMKISYDLLLWRSFRMVRTSQDNGTGDIA